MRHLPPEYFSEQLHLIHSDLLEASNAVACEIALQRTILHGKRGSMNEFYVMHGQWIACDDISNVIRYNGTMQVRLQKILSAQGICSRRKAEEYIQAGLVKVNGAVATIGQKADPEVDRIEVDGSVLKEREEMLYYLMNKPIGIITSNVEDAEHHDPTVRDLLPKELQGKIYPVGRLDKETSGLLLFTNDGVLAYRLTHPKFDHQKEYEVEVTDPITIGQLRKLREGIMIDSVKTKPAIVTRISAKKFRIALTEGKNRQIRRMCQKVGAPLASLKRVRIMTLSDSALQPGSLRKLSPDESRVLLDAVDVRTK